MAGWKSRLLFILWLCATESFSFFDDIIVLKIWYGLLLYFTYLAMIVAYEKDNTQLNTHKPTQDNKKQQLFYDHCIIKWINANRTLYEVLFTICFMYNEDKHGYLLFLYVDRMHICILMFVLDSVIFCQTSSCRWWILISSALI